MTEQSLVRIDTDLALQIRTICRLNGTSITALLNKLVSDYLERASYTNGLYKRRDEILKRQERNAKKGSKTRLTPAEEELLDRFQPQSDPGPAELDKEGKPELVFHPHNYDPVPERWRSR